METSTQDLFTVNSETETISLNEEALQQLLNDEIKNDKIMIVSVAGEFRLGKSFFMSICERYLDFTLNTKETEGTWMGNEPLEGFRWGRGTKRITTGAQMSQIFRTTLANGEKVVIILLDTQGMSDHSTTTSVNTKIFALSTMISSVQIFFVNNHISESHLKELKFFTDYGTLVQENNENTTNTPYQELLFYVRDWPNAHEYPFGFRNGEKYMEEVLQIKDDQQEELKSVRKSSTKCFTKRRCFLMPSPGLKITSPTFDGKLCDLEDDYKAGLNELIPDLLAKENLKQLLKVINGKTVTVEQFIWYLRGYTNTMNGEKLPSPKDFIHTNVHLSQQLCKEEVLRKYEEELRLLMSKEKGLCVTSIGNVLKKAQEYFYKQPKFGDKSTTESYWMRTKNEIERCWNSLRENKEKVDGIQKVVVEQQRKVEILTQDLNMEKESGKRKVLLGAVLGAGACPTAAGVVMIAAPAVLIETGLFATEASAIATGVCTTAAGGIALVTSGIALNIEPCKIEETVKLCAKVGVGVAEVIPVRMMT